MKFIVRIRLSDGTVLEVEQFSGYSHPATMEEVRSFVDDAIRLWEAQHK